MVKVDLEKCDQCGMCVSVCPASAIMLVQTLTIEQDICTGCGKCVKVCAFFALKPESEV